MATIPASALQPRVDVEQASRHLEILHRDAAGFGSLVLLGNGRRERHAFFPVTELTDDLSTLDASAETLQDVVDNHWNVYTALATFTTMPERGRGTRADVMTVPGVWADLDVKPDTEGYFRSEDEVCTYVTRLPRPTLEVASGSGGRHLYWLTHERLEARAGQNLLLAWLDFLRAEANGFTVENVHDTTRILRLAGTVRWPKADDRVALPHRVELLREGPRYHAEELRITSHDAHHAARVVRDDAKARHQSQLEWKRQALGHRLETYERVRARFNLTQEWSRMLEATGWTLHSDQRGTVARCIYWTRPGKQVEDGKSAATDYVDEKGVASRLMTIYSNDSALSDLFEDGDVGDVRTCSKWRYAVARLFDGDENALLRRIAQGGQLP